MASSGKSYDIPYFITNPTDSNLENYIPHPRKRYNARRSAHTARQGKENAAGTMAQEL